jgi:hypothetical protein
MTCPSTLFVIGPPAVGKMAVGHEIAERTGLRLFHNHLTIELVLRFFPYGSEPFSRLVPGFRRQILEEIAASDLPGAISPPRWPGAVPRTRGQRRGAPAPHHR